MGKVGRPKKKNAVKAGELKSDLCRFSFIAEKKQVAKIKRLANSCDSSIKDFMFKVIQSSELMTMTKASADNEQRLKVYLKSKAKQD